MDVYGCALAGLVQRESRPCIYEDISRFHCIPASANILCQKQSQSSNTSAAAAPYKSWRRVLDKPELERPYWTKVPGSRIQMLDVTLHLSSIQQEGQQWHHVAAQWHSSHAT